MDIEEKPCEPDFSRGNNGLLPVITQDASSGKVLMQAWINREAWETTRSTGFATYWSRSRNRLWIKGERSGNRQEIVSIRLDCDRDSILYRVNQNGGAACHEGYVSCFYREVGKDGSVSVVEKQLFNPEERYGEKL